MNISDFTENTHCRNQKKYLPIQEIRLFTMVVNVNIF